MSEENSSSSNGISALGLLGVLFVGLKLTGFISWSWWYVTMPFWGGLAILAVVCIVILIIWGIAQVFGD